MAREKIKQKKKTKSEKKSVTPKRMKVNLTIPVYDLKGKEQTTLEVAKEIFGIESNLKLVAQYIRVYHANQRQGTSSAKTRGEVKGSTRKIYRQKGTGKARHGDIKAPIFVGGGVVGGPRPGDFSLKMNKKQIKKALFVALSLKFKAGDIFALSKNFYNIEPKTKIFAEFLKTVGLSEIKTLLIVNKRKEKNLVLATRNLNNVNLIDAMSINAYEILNNEKILFLEEALPIMEKHFLSSNKLIKKNEN